MTNSSEAHAGVAAKTANGDIHLGEVERGAVLAQTGCGTLHVAIREGVPAWLDLNTRYGNVHNSLDAAGRPEPVEDTVEVRARSSFGDITVGRSLANDAGAYRPVLRDLQPPHRQGEPHPDG